MANRKRAEARRKAAAKADHGSGKTWMWITIAVVVVAAVIGIVVAATGGDDSPAASDTTASTAGGLSSLPSSQPVTVTGDALPAYDASVKPDPAVGTTAP